MGLCYRTVCVYIRCFLTVTVKFSVRARFGVLRYWSKVYSVDVYDKVQLVCWISLIQLGLRLSGARQMVALRWP